MSGSQEYALDDHSTHSLRNSFEYSEDAVSHTQSYEQVHIASIAEKKRLWWANALINILCIGLWFFFAIVLSMYNKWMFSPKHFGFPYPLFVTTLHMFVQFALAATLRAMFPGRFRLERSPTAQEYGKKVVPTAVTTSLDIGLSNLSLKTISLSFYKTFSLRLVAVIFLIFAGVLLMVATQTHFILSGFILVLSASALGGLRWSLTQLLLRNKKMGLDSPPVAIYCLTPTMGLTLAIISAVVDNWVFIFRSAFFASFGVTLKTTFFLIAPGVLAFCMVLSEFYIIQRAGVVPMSIAGIAKEVATITISAWFFGDELTPLNITGVAITLLGIALFTYHKYRKSIESTVPLDAHGNPLAVDEELDSMPDGVRVELEETQRLTAVQSRSSIEFDGDHRSLDRDSQLLFSIGNENDDSGEERSSQVRAMGWNGAAHGSVEEDDTLAGREWTT